MENSGGFRWDAYSPDFNPTADVAPPPEVPLFKRGAKVFAINVLSVTKHQEWVLLGSIPSSRIIMGYRRSRGLRTHPSQWAQWTD